MSYLSAGFEETGRKRSQLWYFCLFRIEC